MNLGRRILIEKRSAVLPLGIALLVNLLVFILVVYPLDARVTGARARRISAEQALLQAGRAEAAAQAIQAGKARADQQLAVFYGKVLPASLSAARRMTYARLAELATQAHLQYRSRSFEPEDVRNSHLRRLRITMVLAGTYPEVRQFLYTLETAPEFLVLDDVAIVQGTHASSPLILTLELSTYFRVGGDGQ
ncbi:MAG TPA: GspMb/PilO family protein [Vicinamibacterales bacterium]|nr:GspMb/PilO family protein [Vicinamibacterales bacterium]